MNIAGKKITLPFCRNYNYFFRLCTLRVNPGNVKAKTFMLLYLVVKNFIGFLVDIKCFETWICQLIENYFDKLDFSYWKFCNIVLM